MDAQRIKPPPRELTRVERSAMKKLVKDLCANFDHEYGCLLLGAQLAAVFRYLFASLAVLAGGIGPAGDRAPRGITALAL